VLRAAIRQIRIRSTLEEKILLRDISFNLESNNIYTIIGKNGSGKTTLLKALTGLLDQRFYKIDGEVIFKGENLLTSSKEKLIEIRTNKIKYVFQDAVNSFDHLKTFDYYFKKLSKDSTQTEALLNYFLLPPSDKLFKMYPYETSGGMAQRISFILALSAQPDLIILDEPTSGIDAGIANLFLLKLKDFLSAGNHSVLLVTQDIDFAKKISNKIALLSEGSLSEFSSVEKFFDEANLAPTFLKGEL
jgi:ABC-type glutathione transport system ATPase component